MLQVSAETLLKYKHRKVSSVRHFPSGCGPNAINLCPKPAKETSSQVGLNISKVSDTNNVLVASNVAEETTTVFMPPLEAVLDIPGTGKDFISDVAEPPISSTPALLVNNVHITNLEMQKVMESIDVQENKVELNPEKVKLEVQQEMNKDVQENSIDNNPEKVKVEVLQGMEESAEPPKFQDRHCYSTLYRPTRRWKAIRQFPPGCGPNAASIWNDNHRSVLAASASLNCKSLAGKKTDDVCYHFAGISSEPAIRPQIASPKLKTFYGEKRPVSQPQDKPVLQKQEMAGGSALVATTKNILHADVANRRNLKVITGKEAKIDKSVLGRPISDKDFRVQIDSGHTQIKSSLKSESHGKSLLKSGSNEFFVGSSSAKILEGSTIDQTFKNIQIKAKASNSSHLVVKSQPENKRDEQGMLLMENPMGKENDIYQNSSKKRKLLAETSFKSYIPDRSDDSLAATGERVIILALLAAKNCPWRNPRRRTSIISDSIVPKSIMKKEKRFIDKSPASMNLFSYKKSSKCLTVDDDPMLEEGNELSITMTPFVPPESSHKGDDNEEVVVRHKVKRALRLFQLICRKLLQGEESRSKRLGKANRIDLQAASILKDNGEWVNIGETIIGHVPGVEIGDEFHFRVELSIVGLHRPFQAGIDFTNKNGMLLATSIVASGGYQDDMDSSDVLIYSGSGGTSAVGGDKQLGDQKLQRGNLSLKNNIDTQTPVRVIHGFKEKGSDPLDAKGKLVSTFTYDGLYQVESYWQEIGSHGFNVFKFQLRRMTGQPELALKELKRAKLKIREGLCVKDISQGKEKIPIAVVNTIDTDQPMPFKYITKSIYPSWYAKTPSKGCDCTDGCSDSEMCACAVKNGGEIPFNFNGAIVQAKPLIYECGPSCKCSLLCHNRVSQRGIRIQLEIFKTRGRGWGVRSLKSITSGSFICEYIGELLQDGEAEQRTNDEYLFDIGHNYDDRSLWEDLPNLIPGLQSSSECDAVESVGFTIDAAEYGNVGRFINHSCSPNLYAQNCLYDHDDKRMPHIMFFAVDNIPPLQELTYHYNYTIDQVRDSEGNIKQKACHCGSPECCGRLY